MPITLRTAEMAYKNSFGQYIGINGVSEQSTAEQIAAIEAAGEHVLEDVIPHDWTELSEDFDDIKEKIVMSSTDEPDEENNRIWLKPMDSETAIPTYEEFLDAKNALEKYESIANSGTYTFQKSDFESGYWNYSAKAVSTKRIRSKYLIPIKSGMKIVYTNPSLDVNFFVCKTQSSGSSDTVGSGWLTKGKTDATYIIPMDGYLGVNARIDASTTDVTVDDYDCTIDIVAKDKLDFGELSDRLSSEIYETSVYNQILKSGEYTIQKSDLESGYWSYSTKAANSSRLRNAYLIPVQKGMSVHFENPNMRVYLGILPNKTASEYVQPMGWTNAGQDSKEIGFITDGYLVIIVESTNAISPNDYDSIITIRKEDAKEELNGLTKQTVTFAVARSFSSDTLDYTTISDRAASNPIKIPKGGLRITSNPDKKDYSLTFRAIVFKKTASGFSKITQEENPDLYTQYTTTTATSKPVYIPYVENGYVVIATATYNSDVTRLTDKIWVYTGEVQQKGKLPGLQPVKVYITSGVPSIQWGNDQDVTNSTNYYGGFLWLKHARSITVGPKYTVVANIYRLNDDETVTLTDSYWTGNVSDQVDGVQHIDLTQYDYDGFVYYAIECPVMYRARGASASSYKLPIGMGVMSGYFDVYNSVCVDYYNMRQETIEPGLPSILYDNINDFVNYTYPLRFAGEYVNPHDKETNTRRPFTESENVSPAFYEGYNGNTVFLNVTGKSYYTAMANPNSRCYNFRWDGEDVPESVQKSPIGYGITCSDFVCILLGLKENYFGTQFAFGTNPKFDKIKSGWNSKTEMDLLKPGDVLTQCYYKEGATNNRDGHCMICYEKKYVNGQLETITLIEAGYPYTRFTTLYNERYSPMIGPWQTFERLYGYSDGQGNPYGRYKWIDRIKPDKLNRLRDVYDLSTEYRPGKIMCDRGTDSIYCVNDGEVAAYRLPISIVDDETTANSTAVIIYKDGDYENPVATVDIVKDDPDYKKNGMWVLDIKEYITSGGLYTLKLDNIADTVQERFYVQEPFEFTTNAGDAPAGYKRIHIPNRSNLQYMEVNYGIKYHVKDPNDPDDKDMYYDAIRSTYAPDQFAADTSSAAQDETWGVIDVPDTMNVPEEFQTEYATKAVYRYIVLVYGTEYGTFQLSARTGTIKACSGYGING